VSEGSGRPSSLDHGLRDWCPVSCRAFAGGIGGNGAAGGTANGSLGNAAGTSLSIAGGGGAAGRIRINTGCGGAPVIAGTAIISPFESTGCFSKGTLN
jgi:hypothetical protein